MKMHDLLRRLLHKLLPLQLVLMITPTFCCKHGIWLTGSEAAAVLHALKEVLEVLGICIHLAKCELLTTFSPTIISH